MGEWKTFGVEAFEGSDCVLFVHLPWTPVCRWRTVGARIDGMTNHTLNVLKFSSLELTLRRKRIVRTNIRLTCTTMSPCEVKTFP